MWIVNVNWFEPNMKLKSDQFLAFINRTQEGQKGIKTSPF